MIRTQNLVNQITDVIAYGFYPCTIKLNIKDEKDETIYEKITNYFYATNTYQNKIFKVNISDDNFNYEIMKHIEGETILNNKFFNTQNNFKIQNGQCKTNGLINYRHLLMLKDFSNIPFDIELVSDS
jgi:hypothetical protein